MERIPPFDTQHLTSLAKILADTDNGLTGAQLAALLRDSKIPDVTPEVTKWKRLFNALVDLQNKRQFGNHVVVFIKRAMSPVQYTTNPHTFARRRDQLNAVLSFSGISLGEDGQVRWSAHASNLDEALARATRLHSSLVSRAVHEDVLKFCRAELVQETTSTLSSRR